MDQPPAVALTAFADAWPRAIETEIGAAPCAIRRGKDFDFDSDIKGKPIYIQPPFYKFQFFIHYFCKVSQSIAITVDV